MHDARTRPRVEVSADAAFIAFHAESRLLTDAAALIAKMSAVLPERVMPQTVHDLGWMSTDLALMIGDGGGCLSDRWRLRAITQAGSVRLRRIRRVGGRWTRYEADLTVIELARAPARELARARRAEQSATVLPSSLVAGQPLLALDGRPVLVIEKDATLVVGHSD